MMIPGLDVCPAPENNEIIRDLGWIKRSLRIPKSHIYGSCRCVKEIDKIKTMKATSSWIYRKCFDKKINANVCVKKQKSRNDTIEEIDKTLGTTINEIQILTHLKHDNIIAFLEPAVNESYGSNYLVLEDVEYFLSDLIDQKIEALFERAMIKNIFCQITQGLDYLHSMLVMHRDLHPKNLMFRKDGLLKIANFERAREFCPRDEVMKAFIDAECVPLEEKDDLLLEATCKSYLAPEILLQAPKHGLEIDIWAAGCILAKLFLLEEIFPGDRVDSILKSIFNCLGIPNDNQWPGYSSLPGLQTLKVGCLQKYNCLDLYFKKNNPQTNASIMLLQDIFVYNPAHRVTAKELLLHPYFKENPPAITSAFFPSLDGGSSP